jgi:putative oxidoreductase
MCICTYMERNVMDTGLLLLHGFLGAALAAHALQKLIVFRPGGTAAYLESLGFRSPRLMAAAVIASELTAGLLVAAGLLLPLGAAVAASTMVVAARTDHRGKGWFITGSGAEYVATNAVVAVAVAGVGGGRYSLDHALGIASSGAAWAVAVAAAALVAAGLVLGVMLRHGPRAA